MPMSRLLHLIDSGGRQPRRVAATLGVLALVAALLALTAPAPDRPGEPITLPEARPLVGFAINAHHIGDLPLYLRSVDRIAELGANALIVVTPMYQRFVDSTLIEVLPDKCPTAAQLIAILKRAREHGMQTTLLPIVLIERPQGKEWRGVIEPSDWDAWWRSYDDFIERYVEIANRAHVDLLSVGSELNTTEDQISRWERIVQRVRRTFGGQLTYSANWDRYHVVRFWELVDVMSVSAYFELVPADPDAPFPALVEAWAVERDRMLDTARHWQRPLLLSEVGYPTLPWASAHPWNYVATGDVAADPEAQARCYRAFFETWTGELTRSSPAGPAAGFFCYRWDPYHRGGPQDTGYGVRGKPAHEIITAGFAEILRRAGAASGPSSTQQSPTAQSQSSTATR